MAVLLWDSTTPEWVALDTDDYGFVVQEKVIREMFDETRIELKVDVSAAQYDNWLALVHLTYLGVMKGEDWCGYGRVEKLKMDVRAKELTVECFGRLHLLKQRYFDPEQTLVLARFPITSVDSETAIKVDLTWPQLGPDMSNLPDDALNGYGLVVLDKTPAGRIVLETADDWGLWNSDCTSEYNATYYVENGAYTDTATANATSHQIRASVDAFICYDFTGITDASVALLKTLEVVIKSTLSTGGALVATNGELSIFDWVNAEFVPMGNKIAVPHSEVTNFDGRIAVVTSPSHPMSNFIHDDGATNSVRIGLHVEHAIDWTVDYIALVISTVSNTQQVAVAITDMSVAGGIATLTCADAEFISWGVSGGADISYEGTRDEVLIIQPITSTVANAVGNVFTEDGDSGWDSLAGFLTSDIGGANCFDITKACAELAGVYMYEDVTIAASKHNLKFILPADMSFSNIDYESTGLTTLEVIKDYTTAVESVIVYGGTNPFTNRPYVARYWNDTSVAIPTSQARVEDRSLVSNGACKAKAKALYNTTYGDGITAIKLSVKDPDMGNFTLGAKLDPNFANGDFLSYDPLKMIIQKTEYTQASGVSECVVHLNGDTSYGWESYARRIDAKLAALIPSGFRAPSVQMKKLNVETTGNSDTNPTVDGAFAAYAQGGRGCAYANVKSDGSTTDACAVNFVLPSNYREGGKVVIQCKALQMSAGTSKTLKVSGYVTVSRSGLTLTTYKATYPAAGTYDIAMTASQWVVGVFSELSAVLAGDGSSTPRFLPCDGVGLYLKSNGSSADVLALFDADAWCEVVV